ncbi:MAG: methyltransferase domain-containing protein [Thermoproteota archaeon]
MDITPAMLLSLVRKNTNVKPFVGVAENIEGSIREARTHFNIPLKFDAVFSTLMLHHIVQPEKVFESIKKVLKQDGKAIIIDLCEHSFEEFRREMGDIHLGFKPEEVYKMARKSFSNVEVNTMPGIGCKCSGRSVELFVAYMQNSP